MTQAIHPSPANRDRLVRALASIQAALPEVVEVMGECSGSAYLRWAYSSIRASERHLTRVLEGKKHAMDKSVQPVEPPAKPQGQPAPALELQPPAPVTAPAPIVQEPAKTPEPIAQEQHETAESWGVQRYNQQTGKPMPNVQIYPTRAEAEARAATMQNATIPPRVIPMRDEKPITAPAEELGASKNSKNSKTRQDASKTGGKNPITAPAVSQGASKINGLGVHASVQGGSNGTAPAGGTAMHTPNPTLDGDMNPKTSPPVTVDAAAAIAAGTLASLRAAVAALDITCDTSSTGTMREALLGHIKGIAAPAPTTEFGCSATALIRWVAVAGWGFKETRTAFNKLGIPVADATIKTQLQRGRSGDGKVPELSMAQQERLLAAAVE